MTAVLGSVQGENPAMRVLIVPGAAVRRYVEPAAQALQARGVDTELLAAPGGAGVPADLRAYGEQLGRRLAGGPPVDLLVGLSVGAQAAVVAAAAAPSQLRQLILVSPTVDPQARTAPRLLTRWLSGGRVERRSLLRE